MNKEIAKMNQRAFEFARESETQLVTTKEVAEALNTTKDVVLANARKCLPNKQIEHGKATYWTQAEVTILLDYMKLHTSNNRSVEFNSTVENTSTDLTPALKNQKGYGVMTTAQVAEALNVGESTVKRAVEKLGSVLGGVSKNSQGGYLFNERQVTAIKQEIAKHHNLASRQIDKASTELEVLQNYKQATEAMIAMLTAKTEALKAENEAQKQRLAIVEPKAKWYDDFADCTGLIEIGAVGKHLEKYGLGAQKIFTRLKDDGIIYEKTVDGVKSYFAYFRYRQYFAYRNGKYEKPDGKKIAYSKLMCTKAGAQWLESKYSVQA